MDIEQISVPKEKAEEEYTLYKEALKRGKTQFLRDMKAIYAHMKHGRAIIDVFDALPKGGLNDDGNPNLAICRADVEKCYLFKERDGSATYYYHDNRWRPRKDDVTLPKGSFEWVKNERETILKRYRETPLPVIPAKFLIPLRSLNLANYHILWEVEKWQVARPPRDPILLKRITPNIFVVLATWNLTPLERAVIKGRLDTQ